MLVESSSSNTATCSSQQRIRVLLTVPHLNPTASPYRETMSLAKYLPADGFDLTICSLRDRGFNQTAPLLERMGVRCLVAPFRPTGRTAKHYLTSLRAYRLIDSYGPFQLQHSMDFTSSPFEALIAKTRSRAFIFSQRNLNENGHRILLKIKTKCADRIISISEGVTQFLKSERVPLTRISNIHLGIDLEQGLHHPVPSPTGGRYLLMVSQFEPRKRHQDAIQALALLKPEFPDVRLLLTGNVFDETYRDGLQKMAAGLGVSERVEFLGPRQDVLDLMRAASAVLLCSEREAFGWVILEAMAAQTPIIASAAEGPRQLIQPERTGLLVAVGDAAGFAAQIRRVLTDPELASALTERARAFIETDHSARKMVSEIGALYREVLRIKETRKRRIC